MQVAQVMAGYSLGQADLLRRGISKKNAQLLESERASFIKRSMDQGYEEDVANKVYHYIEKFANYGFNRSDAFAYSVVALQMAYLKANYPGPCYKALLQSAQHQTLKMKEYIHDAKKRGLTLCSPSINQSHYGFSLQTSSEIRFGLSNIKGVRRDVIQGILQERRENGYYTSFEQFLYRLNASNSKWLKQENIKIEKS